MGTCYFQDYTITMYLNQYWKDERLSFSPEENKILTLSGDFAEKIWVPDTFFANDKNRYSGTVVVFMTKKCSMTWVRIPAERLSKISLNTAVRKQA